ncbi:MAG: Clp protease N-terminal domain-containing protein [Hyphomicrobiaceae bacterium]
MTQAFVEALNWVPKSSGLATTLMRAFEYAKNRLHRQVTIEHLVLALTADRDALALLQACGVDVARLLSGLSAHMGQLEMRPAAGGPADPTADPDLLRILEYSVAAARPLRCEVNGAVVVAAIVGEGRSVAAQALRVQGVVFEETIKTLQRLNAMARQPAAPGPSIGGAVPAATEAGRSVLEPRRPVPPPGPARAVPPPPIRDAETPRTQDLPPKALRRPDSRQAEGPPATGASLGEQIKHPPPRSEAQVRRAPPPPPAPEQEKRTGPPPPPSPQPEPPPLPPPSARERTGRPPGSPEDRAAQAERGRAPQNRPESFDRMAPMAPPPLRRPPAASEGAAPADERSPPPMQRAAAPQGYASAPPPQPAPPPRPAERQVEPGQLVENIPRTMRVGVSETVEVRVGKAQVEGLAAGLAGGAHRHDIVVAKAMAVRLGAPESGFWIETRSPETQWIENRLGLPGDDFASWRWTVTPQRRGRSRLQLVISARTVGADGLTAESVLPDQTIEVRVKTNYGQVAARSGRWVAVALAGGVLGRFGEDAVAALMWVLRKVGGA